MVTMLSTIANKGKYVKPRLVKTIIKSDTEEREKIEPEYKNQVISEETAEKSFKHDGIGCFRRNRKKCKSRRI